MIRKFDFKKALEQHSPQKVAWLKENYKKPIIESFFVEEMLKLKKYSKNPHNYCPSRLKKDYKRLKEIYGFFK